MTKFKKIDLTGQRFGRLLVIKEADPPLNLKKKRRYWFCQCNCGNTTIVSQDKLRNGNTKSCGCYLKEIRNNIANINKKYNIYDLTKNVGIGYTNNNNHIFYFDLEDYDKIKNYGWFMNGQGYIITDKINETDHKVHHIRMHKLLMNVGNNIGIDHKNGLRYDNQKNNLRYATNQQNGFNKALSKNNTSGYKGVSWSNSRNIWQSNITVNRKHIYLGSFQDKNQAILKRKEAEIKYFGEYARQEEFINNTYIEQKGGDEN